MTRKPFFPYPSPGDGLYSPAAGGFAQLAAAELGDNPDMGAGFDSWVPGVTSAIGSLPGHHKTIADCFRDLSKAVNFADSIPFHDVEGQIQAATAAQDPLLGAIADSVGSLPPSTSCPGGPPPVPPILSLQSAGAPAPGPSPSGSAQTVFWHQPFFKGRVRCGDCQDQGGCRPRHGGLYIQPA